MAKRIAVVVSQGQSQNPAKRGLEEDIVAALIMEPGVDVTVIPHLYDLKPDGTGMLALDGIKGNMIVLSWLYERGARWILDRNNICGQEGQTLIKADDEDKDDEENAAADDAKARVIDQRDIPNRRIYCVDLRVHHTAQPYIDEIKRIADESTQKLVQLGDWLQGVAKPEQLERFVNPTNTTALGGNGNGKSRPEEADDVPLQPTDIIRIEETGDRRWYPVIDYSRCTNCMECIDFCLFGVYGVDRVETILVEQPDNCRKGCPACSRVCPENAIMFPQHKTPAIAGAPVGLVGLKIDLSKLFGAPDEGKSAEEMAALERDEQLVMVGRDAVGMAVGIRKRQEGVSEEPRDELDDLIDGLDELDI
ncbi:MAG: ferredoxin family protein [Planctomycetes bacterium]|nr:ferredoxin family protein [Planctomycetota bacterium]